MSNHAQQFTQPLRINRLMLALRRIRHAVYFRTNSYWSIQYYGFVIFQARHNQAAVLLQVRATGSSA